MKQRQIHEQREERKAKIASYEQELSTNDKLYPRLVKVTEEVAKDGPSRFSSIVERLQTQPDPDSPGPGHVPYDKMMLELLLSIWKECKEDGVDATDSGKLGRLLVKKLKGHQEELQARQELRRKQLAHEKEEQQKKITSDDMHEGFSSAVRSIHGPGVVVMPDAVSLLTVYEAHS